MELVSVIVPVHNNENTIDQCVQSVLGPIRTFECGRKVDSAEGSGNVDVLQGVELTDHQDILDAFLSASRRTTSGLYGGSCSQSRLLRMYASTRSSL